MSLKLGNILKTKLDENIISEIFTVGKGDMFKDYVPISFFKSPQYTELDLNGEQVNGQISLSSEDYDSHIDSVGEKKDSYTFNLKKKDGKEISFKIKGSELYDPINETMALRKDKSYLVLLGNNDDSEQQGIEDQNISVDEETFSNLDNDLKDLKSQASKVKSLNISGKTDKDPNFVRNLVLNFANSSKTNIKIQGKSLFDTLKKLSDDKIVEKEGKKWTDEVSIFFNDLFKLFSELHKCCRENKLYIRIKKFLKNLYETLKSIRGNYKDQDKRNDVYDKIVLEMGEMIGYISTVNTFSNQGQKSESLIKEQKQTANIKFNKFNIKPQQVADETEEEIENLYSKEDLSSEDMERLAFKLYGKDAGKFFPNLSFKNKDITTLFGLLGKGGIKTSQEKMMDKYGIYNLDYATGEDKSRSMDKLPKFKLKFNEDVLVRDENDDTILKIRKGDELTFNYDKKNKVLIHKTSGKKYGNVSQIYIDMLKEPSEGENYDKQKIVKLIPIKGPKFAVQPNYRVNFTIV